MDRVSMSKSQSTREASHHTDFMGNYLTVSQTSQLYLPKRWVFLLVPGVAEQNEHAGWI